MKVKSEREVAQLYPTLSDPMDYSLPGSSIHGILRQEYWSGVPLPSLTMEYYSAIERNTFESVLMTWMNLEPIIQSEVSQKRKYKYCILTYVWNLERWYY